MNNEYKFKKQYVIKRDRFVEIFNQFFQSFDNFDDNYLGIKSEEFISFRDFNLDTIFIINLRTLQVISWYKYAHVGRCLETIGIETENDVIDFFSEFVGDVKESRVRYIDLS